MTSACGERSRRRATARGLRADVADRPPKVRLLGPTTLSAEAPLVSVARGPAASAWYESNPGASAEALTRGQVLRMSTKRRDPGLLANEFPAVDPAIRQSVASCQVAQVELLMRSPSVDRLICSNSAAFDLLRAHLERQLMRLSPPRAAIVERHEEGCACVSTMGSCSSRTCEEHRRRHTADAHGLTRARLAMRSQAFSSSRTLPGHG